MIEHRWLTVAEAARYAQCGRRAIYNAVRDGHLRAARLGGKEMLRIRPEWVDAWLDGCAPEHAGSMTAAPAATVPVPTA